MQCATHPEVETNLSCGKCGKPICPRCMVQTPVGARCPQCAKLYKLPTYSISSGFYLRAAAAALGMAVIGGAAWGIIGNLVSSFIPFFLNFVLAGVVGYGVGEVVGLAVNRKRGRGLAIIGGTAVVAAYAVSILTKAYLLYGSIFFHLGFISIFGLLAVAVGIYTAVMRLK